MRLRFLANRRLLGYLLSLAMLAMAVSSHVSWQCLNGNPCAQNCAMLRADSSSTLQRCSMSGPATSHCAHCLTAPIASLAGRITHPTACATQQCVLRYQPQPTTSLASRQILTLPMLALPPPVGSTTATTESVALYAPATPVFYPPRFQRPSSGRAPPLRLV